MWTNSKKVTVVFVEIISYNNSQIVQIKSIITKKETITNNFSRSKI